MTTFEQLTTESEHAGEACEKAAQALAEVTRELDFTVPGSKEHKRVKALWVTLKASYDDASKRDGQARRKLDAYMKKQG